MIERFCNDIFAGHADLGLAYHVQQALGRDHIDVFGFDQRAKTRNSLGQETIIPAGQSKQLSWAVIGAR